jgi:CheY-like chemotaxis protein
VPGPFRILVVDDNHLIRRLLDLILEGAGYVAIEAESGEAALAIAHEVLPDLCVVDEAMPGMLGSEVVRALRRSPEPMLASVPVIGISGRTGAARELFAAGATAFVRKPIEEHAILAAVARALVERAPHASPPDQPAA